MSDDLIDYKRLVRDSLRQVVRAVLKQAVAEGLPGDHHFYISFSTRAPGVSISDNLRAQHPDEMTIVLQHQYWDLSADDESFGVTLSFNRTKERLTIPFMAVLRFHDPAAPFGLSFDLPAPAREPPEPTPPEESEEGGNVLSLDRFRNK